ncbi:MAG: hypothetical protein WD794_07060 [Mycobacteriales bacterium]
MKRTLISGAVLALAVGATGVAQAERPSGFKVTGGGQIIADGSGGGAGDTVGFNAQEIAGDRDDAARGQFQYVPRGQSGNASAPTEKFHGVVTCLISGGEAMANEEAEDDGQYNEALTEGSARFGGHLRDDPATFFTVDVTDNGQGGNAEDDLILVRITAEACADNPEDEEDDAEDLLRLGRGNVKIHNNPDGADGASANLRMAAAFAQLAAR